MSDLKAFEEFLDRTACVEMCLNLYLTWIAIYSASGFMEHFRAMQRAKRSLVEYKSQFEQRYYV